MQRKPPSKVKMRTCFYIALIGIMVGGCSLNPPEPAMGNPPQTVTVNPQIRYIKSGATQEEFMKDRYECIQEAQQRVSGAYVGPYGGASSSKVVINCGMLTSCMGARGYTVDPYGNLAAPPGMVVYCQH
ncbi:MAG TPA: hypothetical protein VEI95_05705 [Acidobacteriota bacterium]|nr:hypothetical protein [Acidobacteriota bacterium]